MLSYVLMSRTVSGETSGVSVTTTSSVVLLAVVVTCVTV